MTLYVHIERLVIDASLGIDPRGLEAALAEGLAQALREQACPRLPTQGVSIPALAGGTLRLHGPAASWGRQIGHSLHATLAGPAAEAP
jgi:hypothetical protein